MKGGDILSKTNKELAVDVAIAAINSNPKIPVGPNNTSLSHGIDIKSICNIIQSVNSTLDNIDQNSLK